MQWLATSETRIQQKFELLFREHFTGLCFFAQKYLGDLDASKEVVHSVFVKIWENRNEFDWEKPAKSYLFTSVYNRSLNHLRDRKKFIAEPAYSDGTLIAESSEFSDNMVVSEMEGKIKQVIQNLPEKCREVFELSRFEGKKYNEIAAQLGISVKTVETQMSKALQILREELKEYLFVFLLFILKNNDWL